MNDESVFLKVVLPNKDDEATMEIRLVDGFVIEIFMEGEKICSGDWDNNFKEVFERILKIWK